MTHAAPLPAAPRRGFRLTGWHVLTALVVFFGVTIAVDTVMILQAYKTYPGEVAASPYEVGLSYDKELAQQAAQSALGWRLAVDAAAPGRLRLFATDARGAALRGLDIDARLERPATVAGGHAVAFHEVASGVYEARAVRRAGAWDLKLAAVDRHGHRFEAERRLVTP